MNTPIKKQLIYGRHPIEEALLADKKFDKILLQRGLQADVLNNIVELAKEKEVAVQFVPFEKLNRVTRKAHQGVVGFLSLVTYYTVEDVLSQVYDKGEVPFFLICDGITDVRNFGAMARTAICTGIHGIIMTQKGSANINGDAMKASAGALHKIPICKVRFLDETIKYLQNNGLQIIASSLQTPHYPKTIDWSIPTALIMGAEDKGVSPKHLRLANQAVKIPIIGDFDSYNVSVATGMILYEAMQQRM